MQPSLPTTQPGAFSGPMVLGVPFEFIFFALTLIGVALLHKHTLAVALVGVGVVIAYKLGFSVFGHEHVPGFVGFLHHLRGEWVTLANLLGLLTGFALLANAFERSKVPDLLPRVLPDDWKGGLALLLMVAVLSSFLDNIAAAMIGGTVATVVFRRRVHIGFVAAIVAASNAGGAGSVIGDTTTTMMWIQGASPLSVVHGYYGALAAVLICGIVASIQQQRHQPILCDPEPGVRVDWGQLGMVAIILGFAIGANLLLNTVLATRWRADAGDIFPWIGASVWVAILIGSTWRKPDWKLLPGALKGSAFLLSLVLCASLVPVEKLPLPSWQVACGLGFVSAVFDNIPLTALAIAQDGYDWGMLAYAVGFGGSMIWFGSSAGVAIIGTFPEAKSAALWLRHGWHVTVAYVVGCAVLMLVAGWHPSFIKRGATGGAHPTPATAHP
jgi:Na+/H+ antiporter NhaD/arsenite permease-like protein